MQIKPIKRLIREKPEPLAVPNNINECWSMDFMHDQPGNPQQNACIERYNRTVKYGWLNQFIFESIDEVQLYATQWLWTEEFLQGKNLPKWPKSFYF